MPVSIFWIDSRFFLEAYACKDSRFSPCWVGRLLVAEVVEVPQVGLRLVLVLRVLIGLVESPCGVAQMFFGFWFLKSAEKIDGVDKFFFRDFMLILLPLLLHFCVESVTSAFTGHLLLQRCQVVDHSFQFAGLDLPLFERDCFRISLGFEPVGLESSDRQSCAVVGDER